MTKNNGYQPATKAIILARVSTKGQGEEDRFSLPAQLRKLREYVKDGGKFGTIKEVITELRIKESAYKGKRTKFREALKIVEKYNEPIAIVFDVVDRFTRRWKEVSEFDSLREEGKIELHFVSQGLALHRNSRAYEIQNWETHVLFAKNQSVMISERVKDSIREKLLQGKISGYVPSGYLNTDIEVAPGKFVKVIKIDSGRAPFVIKCFELYATGKYSMERLTHIMRESGFTIKPKRVLQNDELVEKEPRLCTINDIAEILGNPFYAGRPMRKDPYTGEYRLWDINDSYEPLITWSLFQKVQEVLKVGNTRVCGYKNNKFKFQGFVTCGFCDCLLTPEEMSRTYKDKNSAKAKEAIYYHCTSGKAISDPDFYKKTFGTEHSGVYVSKKGKRKGQTIYSCPQRWWKESEIEESILAQLDMIHYGEEFFDWLRKILKSDYEERTAFAKGKIKVARTKYTQNEDIIRTLVISMAKEEDLQLKEDYHKNYQSLKKKQEELRNEIALFDKAIEYDTDETMDKLRFCCNLRDQYESLDDEGRRELLSVCFSKISAYRGDLETGKKCRGTDGIQVIWQEPFTTLFEINLDELVIQDFEKSVNLTKVEEIEASLKP
jgi:DNA invertase Pin-like site-specific DNA recombinase